MGHRRARGWQTAELRNGLNLKCFELERLTVSREEAAALAKQALLLPPAFPSLPE